MTHSRHRWIALLLVVHLLFFWKILFTRQFSVLVDYEAANVGYSWQHFLISSIKQGTLPLWDPYTFSGHSFLGEMQTAVFDPLKLWLYPWPLNHRGLFSPQLYHVYYAALHLLAACLMFVLAEELGLTGFAAFVASLCFALAGTIGSVGWPNILSSAAWLPLVIFFQLRAFRSEGVGPGVLYACLSGLALGMVVLAGSPHVAIMDALAVVSTAAYLAFQEAKKAGASPARRWAWIRAAVIVAFAGVLSFAAGAVQLFPSMEYGRLAFRYVGGIVPAAQKIPYALMSDGLLPRSLFVLLHFAPGVRAGEFNIYFGVMPLLLVVIGIWRNWDNPFVRYLTGLAGLALFYSFGSLSLLHGLAYALVPFLWMAREAERFIYLTHFAMAVLAGFGARTLLAPTASDQGAFRSLAQVLKWFVIVVAVALAVPALYGKPEVWEWAYFSFLLILGSYGLFQLAIWGASARVLKVLLAALIVCDLYAFHWNVQDRVERQKAGSDHLQILLDCGNLANFLKSQAGLFRVDTEVDSMPNIGDLYGVQTTMAMAATMLKDYERFRAIGPRAHDLLNVRFRVRRNAEGDQPPVYADGPWKVYERASYYPRAWVVLQAVTEPSGERVLQLMQDPDFDARRLALVSEPLETPLPPPVERASAQITFGPYRANRLEARVSSQAPGLLVFSEVYYPGWQATVNENPAHIYKVNGVLRGVVVPAGESQVVLRYSPGSVKAGAALTLAAFLGTLVFAVVVRFRRQEA